MATNNALNNTSAPFTVSSGNMTVTLGDAVLTAGNVSIGNVAAATTSPITYFKKSRAGAALSTGDFIGTIKFSGYDGTQYTDGARITSEAAAGGTVGNQRIYGNLKFYTHPDSAAANPTLRMTIDGEGRVTIAAPDTGTGLTVTASGISTTKLMLPTSTSTAGQIQFNNSVYAHNYGKAGRTGNFFLGFEAGNYSCTSGDTYNTALGAECMKGLTSGTYNMALGYQGLYALTSGDQNTACGGVSTLDSLTTGKYNCAIGAGSLHSVVTGNGNTGIGAGGTGFGSGKNHTLADSWNIDIGHGGVAGESNKMRLGTQINTGVGIDAAYIAGVYTTAAAPSGTAKVSLIDSAHLIYGLAGTAGQILQGGTAPAFSTATYPATTAQGDLLLSTSANTIQALTKDTTATRYLSNTGTNNNAAWAQVALATGVSGTLPPANGGRNTVSESTTSNTVQMAVNTTYIATSTDGATLVTYTLPATAAVGDIVKIIGKSTAFWAIAQNATDTCHNGNLSTTPGATGTITTAHVWASVTLECITASSIWAVTASAGTITLA